jgi:type I restriction enzyme S subunit
MLPDGWKLTTLEKLGTSDRPPIKAGPFGSSLKKEFYVKSGYKVYGQEQVIAGDLSIGNYYIDSHRFESLKSCAVQPGDVLISLVGTFGKAVVVPNEAEPGIINPRLIRLSLDSSKVDPFFIKEWLVSPTTQNLFNDVAHGGTMGVLNAQTLKSLQLLLPPLPEQKKIAEILSSVDEAIASTQAVINQTRKVKQGLLQQLLTRGIGHTKFKESAIGRIPEEWKICSVGELGIFSNGHGFKPEEWSDKGVPIIRIQNLNGSLDFNYYAGVPDPKWIVNPGELLFAWAGVKGVSFGPCIWSGSVGVLNQHIYRIQPQHGVDKYWLFWTLEEITKQIEGQAHGFKYSLLHVRKADIVGQLVAFPPFEEQQEIAKRLASISEFQEKHQSSLDRLTRLKRGLMQDLLTGKVRVGCTS